MAESIGILSLLPPVVALGIALWKKQIIPGLLLGCLAGEFLLLAPARRYAFFYAFLDRTIVVASQPGNLMLIIFSLLIGSLVALIKKTGGFRGLVHWLERSAHGPSKSTAYGLTWLIGGLMFLENWSNILVNGTTLRPVYRKLNIPREKLAYFIHTISINVVALVVINSWGAFYMTLLSGQGVGNTFQLVLQAVPLNFYCLLSLLVVAVTMATGWQLGAMKKADAISDTDADPEPTEDDTEAPPPRGVNMLLPIAVMIVTLLLSLYATGGGSLVQGSGTTSVFYAVVTALLVLVLYALARGQMELSETLTTIYEGMGEFITVGVLLVLALTLGNQCNALGTGPYIAALARQNLPLALTPAAFFFLSCVISFATGTSYGTFSIMIPLAVPLAQSTGVGLPLIFAACISGGVFGDNCSPISDTSIVTGIAAEVDVVQHVRTQLPYALVSASGAVTFFLIAGFMS